jgi:hypothetical protein
MAVLLRRDFDAAQLRGLAKKTKDGPQARRLLALPVPHHQFPDSHLPDDLNPMSSKKKTNVNKDSDEGPQK